MIASAPFDFAKTGVSVFSAESLRCPALSLGELPTPSQTNPLQVTKHLFEYAPIAKQTIFDTLRFL